MNYKVKIFYVKMLKYDRRERSQVDSIAFFSKRQLKQNYCLKILLLILI